jgi:plastocyanin
VTPVNDTITCLEGEPSLRISSIWPGRHLAAVGVACALLAGVAGCNVAASGYSSAPPTATPMVMPTAAPAPAATPVATTTVTIQNFAFSPPAIVVPVGATVTWTNRDAEQHTVTAVDRSFDSDALNPDQPYSFTFAKAGTYQYMCLIHPQMRGTVVVR